MVREANMKKAASEKQLKEAWGKVRPIPVCLGQQPKVPVTVLAGRCNRSLTDLPETRNGRAQVWDIEGGSEIK